MSTKQTPWGEVGYITYKRCVDKHTPVLCADLSWRTAGSLKEGEEIIGFDAEYKGKFRYIKKGKVLFNNIEKAKCVGIELSTGEILYSTPDHEWLVKMAGNKLVWREAKDLGKTKKGTSVYLPRVFGKPWFKDNSYESGYLAAAFDGEGSIDKTNSIFFTQVNNEMLERVDKYLKEKGYSYKIKEKHTPPHRQQCYDIRIYGIKNIFNILGTTDSVRLKRKLFSYLDSSNGQAMRTNPDDLVKVVNVFDAGEREIAVLSTDLETHFTGGFPSHNTYARRLKESDANSPTEEWEQTVDRIIEACDKQLKVGFTKKEQGRLKYLMMSLKGNVAGRFLWQLGTPTVKKLGLASLQNCFGKETEFMTKNGIRKFEDCFDGETVTVRGRDKWVEAKVKNFGKQQLYTLIINKGKRVETVRVTGNHRWILDDNAIVTTEELKPGQELRIRTSRTNFHNLKMCPIAIQHGLVFGDGNWNENAKACAITICGDSQDELKSFFKGHDTSKHEISGLPWNWKKLPSLMEVNKHYLYGFMAGWFAADGSIGKNGSNITLASASKDQLQWARGALSLLDITTSEVNLSRELSPFDGTEKPLYRITIDRENLPKKFLLLSKHFKRFKPLELKRKWKVSDIHYSSDVDNVWCVVEPENEEFSLSNGILTKNCAFTVVDEPIRPFTWAMDMLMLGSGVGYNIQREYVYKLPKAKRAKISRLDTKDADFIVPDSREGWVKLLHKTLESHFITGKGFSYSTICIRGKGELIKGFGGLASGPNDLCTGIEQISEVLNNRAGKQIRPIDCLDIMNIIGQIVVAGNVRRSAQIAIGDMDDLQFLNAKRWDLGNIPNWRAMSNNSVVCNDFSQLPEQFWQGYKGNGEPYGLINLNLARNTGRIGEDQYKDLEVCGFNPCQPGFATVLTKDGVKTFDDISIGDTIWSKEGWTKVVNKWSTGIKDVYEYRTTGGVFVGTKNHKLDTPEGKVEAEDCEKVLTIAGPEHKSIEHNPYVVADGLFLGNGYHKKMKDRKYTYPCLVIGKDDQDYFKSEIAFLIENKMQEGNGREDWRFNTSITSEDKAETFELIIPKRYMVTDSETKLSLLRGLYSANGSVIKQSVGCRVTYKTASKELSKQIQQLLSEVGIRSYITTNKEKEVQFDNGTYLCKESYDINITKDVREFARLIGFIQNYKMNKIEECIKDWNPNNRQTYTSVKEKTFLGEYEVFDITVDNESHTYWTGGLSVSNCAEQSLAPFETCCLAEIYLPNIESKDELLEVSKYLYRINKHSLALKCHHPETQDIVHKNMRMGIGVTGYLQAPKYKRKWLSEVYDELRLFDRKYSNKHGFPTSIKLTTVKPSGTLSLLAGVTPGAHPGYSHYHIRRIRMASNIPLVDVCRNAGYPVEFVRKFDGTEDKSTVVVSFPCKFPKSTTVAEQMTAIDQLEVIKELQNNWSDNAVSVTIYYRKEELEGIKDWLSKNFNDNLKTVSFLLHSEHGFDQAPLEEITEEQYNEMKKNVTPITAIGSIDEDSILDSFECETGICPVK